MMSSGPLQDIPQPLVNLDEAAERLEVPEASIREWLATFNWERRFDGDGHLLLTERDLAFLRVIKSLKQVDRSCESIVRIINEEDPLDVEIKLVAEPIAAEPEPSATESNLAQIATLKAELKELHAKPAKKPFWKFWGR